MEKLPDFSERNSHEIDYRIYGEEMQYVEILTGKRNVSFASPYPGKIMPIDLNEYGGKFICQKDAFLCAAKGVSVGIEFSKKLGRGLFGGEGLSLGLHKV